MQRVKELRLVLGFQWKRSYSMSSQQGNSSKCKPVIQTKFSESVAIIQQVLGDWFLFSAETPCGDNNSRVCHRVGFDSIWMSKWKGVKDYLIGRCDRRSTRYYPVLSNSSGRSEKCCCPPTVCQIKINHNCFTEAFVQHGTAAEQVAAGWNAANLNVSRCNRKESKHVSVPYEKPGITWCQILAQPFAQEEMI